MWCPKRDTVGVKKSGEERDMGAGGDDESDGALEPLLVN